MFGMGLNCGKLLSRNKRFYRANPICRLTHARCSCNSATCFSRSFFQSWCRCRWSPLNSPSQLLTAVVSLAPLGRMLSACRSATGRPAKDRAALATAFMAKAVLNLPTTRDLISRLRVDEALRQFCGWASARALPHESKFSRAFAEFAATGLPQQLHEAVIAATQSGRLIGHIARDSTAIPARERFSEETKAKKKAARQPPPKRAKGAHTRKKASERGTRIERQRRQKLEVMVNDLPSACDIGAKKNSQGNEQYWTGYKLHLDVADGQIPISAILTSASVHDSQVAIPLMTLTSQRVTHLYELMDSAYDADSIHGHSRQLNHVPIIAPHGRRVTFRIKWRTSVNISWRTLFKYGPPGRTHGRGPETRA